MAKDADEVDGGAGTIPQYDDSRNLGRHGRDLYDTDYDDKADDQRLARLGKKAVLKRKFGPMALLGLSCTVLVTWEGSTVLFSQALQNGGPSGVVYSFIVTWVGNLSVFSCLSELASMAPTSGGQYHWVSMLAPRRASAFLSYMTGWVALAGWQGTCASALYLCGTSIQGVINLCHRSYHPQPYQAVLLIWAVILYCLFFNAVIGSKLAHFENTALVLHITGFFAVLIPLVVLSSHTDASAVFNSFNNGGMFPNQGISFLVGMIGNVFAFVGGDAAFHMAEETHRADVLVPRAVMWTIWINGTAGFAMIIALLFCIGDTKNVLGSSTGYPFMEIFYQGTGSTAGAATMAAIVIILICNATVGCFASASRVTWSFARDHGLPGWKTLTKVSSRQAIPVWSVCLTAVISALLSLIVFGSATAFNDVVGLGVSGLYSSYLIATVLLLYRRCTSGFQMPSVNERLPALANTTGQGLVWGPFHIPGIWGILNNAFAICYLVLVWFFSFWPPTYHPDAASMNYSVLVTGAVVLFSIGYYFVWAHKEYKGPVIETDALHTDPGLVQESLNRAQ